MPNEYRVPMSSVASTLGPRSSPPPAAPAPAGPDEDNLPDDISTGSINPLSAISDVASGVYGSLAGSDDVAAWSAAKDAAGTQLAQQQTAPQAELVQYFVNMGINPATAVQLAQKIGTMEAPHPPIANGVKLRTPGPAAPEQGGSMTDYVRAAGSAVGEDAASKPGTQRGATGLSKAYSIDEWNALPDSAKRDLIRGTQRSEPEESRPAGPGFSGIIKPITPGKT